MAVRSKHPLVLLGGILALRGAGTWISGDPVGQRGNLGVTGTPAIFVNGRRVTNPYERSVCSDAVMHDSPLSRESALLSVAERSTVQIPSYRSPEGEK